MITLVLGGTRSGKSALAERLAAEAAARVTYVATAAIEDREFRARVETHRARRPAAWTTIESDTDLAATVRPLDGTVLIDSLGAWIARTIDHVDLDALCDALGHRTGTTIVVSEEVGLGVHAATPVGVRFADALGECNRRVAGIAERVLLVVAGRVLELPHPDGAR
jgi:adenosyl cobinamide kinase/adenosyl cobinamide phosphate guanylyltransferase